MTTQTEDQKMLNEYYEIPLRTLEQGFNDIEQCTRSSRLRIIFLYEGETVIDKVEQMTNEYLVIKNKKYFYKNIGNIYNYHTHQHISIEQLINWYIEFDY
jgi:hypothetical protein